MGVTRAIEHINIIFAPHGAAASRLPRRVGSPGATASWYRPGQAVSVINQARSGYLEWIFICNKAYIPPTPRAHSPLFCGTDGIERVGYQGSGGNIFPALTAQSGNNRCATVNIHLVNKSATALQNQDPMPCSVNGIEPALFLPKKTGGLSPLSSFPIAITRGPAGC